MTAGYSTLHRHVFDQALRMSNKSNFLAMSYIVAVCCCRLLEIPVEYGNLEYPGSVVPYMPARQGWISLQCGSHNLCSWFQPEWDC